MYFTYGLFILFAVLFFLTLIYFFDIPILLHTFFALYTLLRIFTVFCIYRYTPLMFHSLNILSAFAARIFSSIA